MAKKSSHDGVGRIYGFQPIDRVAKRVLGKTTTKRLLDPEESRDRAKLITNPDEKRELLLEDELAEKKLRTIEKRMTGPKAEARARRAMEAAKWRRKSSKR